MKFILILALATCSQLSFALTGKYKFELQLEKATLPFIIEFDLFGDDAEMFTEATLFNGEEKIKLGKVEKRKNTLIVPIQTYNAAIEMKVDVDGSLKGHWIKYDRKPEYRVPLTAKSIFSNDRIKIYEPPKNIPKEWKITFFDEDGSKKEKLLLLRKKGWYIYGSVAGTTGDYRYLEGTINKEDFELFGFDGIFAFVFKGKIKDNKIEGVMHAGKNFSQKFKAVVDKNYKLPDANKISSIKGKNLFFKLKDVNGNEVKIDQKYYQDKVTVLQIFGSWCPNCIDETNFITKWRKENPKSNVQFLGLSFERSPNKKHAIKMVKKAIKKLKIDYPFLMAGYTDQDKVTDVLPNLKNFKAFPTTIYIDKKGDVRKVHTGFNGPATGRLFTKFKSDFNKVIKKLSSE